MKYSHSVNNAAEMEEVFEKIPGAFKNLMRKEVKMFLKSKVRLDSTVQNCLFSCPQYCPALPYGYIQELCSTFGQFSFLRFFHQLSFRFVSIQV